MIVMEYTKMKDPEPIGGKTKARKADLPRFTIMITDESLAPGMLKEGE